MKTLKYSRIICFGLFLTVILSQCSKVQYVPVNAWEGEIMIPTYGWEDDVNPKFWAMEGGAKGSTTLNASITYPYNMQDHLSRKLENITYKALFLENEYLKITCLPELGGRLHSVLDKTTNKEVFHKNSVIKPGMIAMRGAFISGGVEWNAGPQVHTVTILSPVDALIGFDEDGSAYIEVSNLEKSLRTQWTVRVTLHPGKNYLDEEIKIYNPADAMNPYYFWNCTAFPQLPGTRFIYPMKLGTDHFGVRFFNWPVHNGKDLSYTKNYEDASSIFAVNCAYDFFGAYDVDLDRGVIQVANHHEHSGKKAWTWGQGEYGRVSQMNLTDSDGNYIEVQSGPLQTQSDYGILPPRGEISWKEYWYPVHGLGEGFEYANEKVAIQTFHNEKELEIRIISTENFPGAYCKIFSGNKILSEEQIDLTPEDALNLSLVKPSPDPVLILLEASNGEELAKFESPLPVPEVILPTPPTYVDKPDEKLTIEETYLKAEKFNRALDRFNARKYYNMTLAKDSLHLSSLRELAILDFEAGLYRKAAKRLAKALGQIPNDDGLAWYFLGLCNLQLNTVDEAVKCGFKASRCPGTTSLGYGLIGRGYMLQGKIMQAIQYFEKAYNTNRNDPKTCHQYMFSLYAGGYNELAQPFASKRIQDNPTEIAPRALKAIMEDDLTGFTERVRDYVGEDDFELIETSLLISELGLYNEAIKILETACVKLVPEEEQNLLVLYHLAYLYSLAGNESEANNYLLKAAGTYRDFILASRPATSDVLNYAIENNPEDAQAYYQLGNLLGNFGRLEEAAENWSQAVRLDTSLNIAWRNLGLYYWIEKNDHTRSEECYRRAIKARPNDQTLYRDLAYVLRNNGKRTEAINLLEEMPVENVRRSDIIIDLAETYLEEGLYDECINLLISTPYFVNWEGSGITWNLYNQAYTMKGISYFEIMKYEDALHCFENAVLFPENLGVGKSQRTEEARAYYWRGKTLMAMNRSDEALGIWKTGSELPAGSDDQNHYRDLCKQRMK